MAYPVVAMHKPSSLNGTTNGKLPDNLLVPLGAPGRAAARGHVLAVEAWQVLAAEVNKRFGLVLTVTSSADAYRTYAVQEWTFRQRYTPNYNEQTCKGSSVYKIWNGVRWYQLKGTAMAAVPGTSNHGWGLAFDACYWLDGKTVGITASNVCWQWLLANADDYGFCWEAQSEPWHIRYFAGDAVPKAVYDFHNPNPIPPPGAVTPIPPYTILEGEEMITGLWKGPNDPGVYAVCSNRTKIWCYPGTVDEHQALLRLEGKSDTINEQTSADMFRAFGPVVGPRPGGVDEYGWK